MASREPIYLDNHATTRVDPRVLDAMLPWFSRSYGNPASTTHALGWAAKEAVTQARESIAAAIGAKAREIIFTGGATESNNLAIRGIAERARRKGNHLISVASEHPSVLDPMARLASRGYEVTLLGVRQQGDAEVGRIRLDELEAAIRPDTLLVSVMLANNEIGVIQDLPAISRLCRSRGVPIHTDATQAVGKIPVDVNDLGVDLMSFSAHKMYGPKGCGSLFVRRGTGSVRLEPLIHGGGQEEGLRSGTINVPAVVGFAKALELSIAEMASEAHTLKSLRDEFCRRLVDSIPGLSLNGPALDSGWRLPGNLNVRLSDIDGEALLMSTPGVAASSGSACSSSSPEPSKVLRAVGLSDTEARGSLRFGLGRFTTAGEIAEAAATLADAARRLRQFPLLGSGV